MLRDEPGNVGRSRFPKNMGGSAEDKIKFTIWKIQRGLNTSDRWQVVMAGNRESIKYYNTVMQVGNSKILKKSRMAEWKRQTYFSNAQSVTETALGINNK